MDDIKRSGKKKRSNIVDLTTSNKNIELGYKNGI